MTNLSFLERINVLWEALKNNNISYYIIAGVIVLSIIMLILSRSKKKIIKIITCILFIGILGTFIGMYFNPIINFFDYLIEVVVNNLLFPNIAVYILSIFIIDMSLLVSLLSNKKNYSTKMVNILFFSIIQILLFLIIQNVIKNNVDVYEMLSIYTNQELLVLIESSMLIFVSWIIIRLIMQLAHLISHKNNKSEEVIKKDNYNHNVVLDYNEIMQENGELIEYVPIKKKRV